RSSRSTSSSVLYGANDVSTASPFTLRIRCAWRICLGSKLFRYSTPTPPGGSKRPAGICAARGHHMPKSYLSRVRQELTFGPYPKEAHMTLRIGDTAPNFQADTTQGRIDFHDWIGDKYAVLFSHPKDFTPVCTTELGYMARIKPEFDRRNAKIIGLSVDPVDDHKRWAKDIEETQGKAPNYPIIGDADLNVAKMYDMIHPNAAAGRHTGADNATARSVCVNGPVKKHKLTLTYSMHT